MMADHEALYRRYVHDLNAIEAEQPRLAWRPGADGTVPLAPDVEALLYRPVSSLELGVPSPDSEGPVGAAIREVWRQLDTAGIAWRPGLMWGDGFWTLDQTPLVAVPWYLATEGLAQLVNDRTSRYTPEEVRRCVYHEVGHAILYALHLWQYPNWKEAFGDFDQPYRDGYVADPESTDHVRYLHRSGGSKHYAQKHPDEDWAETFATWLDPGTAWSEEYPAGTGARRKLELVEAFSRGGLLRPSVEATAGPDDAVSYRSIGGTVLAQAGARGPSVAWSPYSETLRREPFVRNAVVLHELFFQGLGAGGGAPGPQATALAAAAYGSVESWLTDLRVAAGSCASGWVVSGFDHRRRRLATFLVEDHRTGVPVGVEPAVVIDCWEHAYAEDYGIRKDAYLGAVFRNMAWEVVEARMPPPAPPPDVVLAPPVP